MFWNSGKYLKIQYTQNYKRLKRKKKEIQIQEFFTTMINSSENRENN